MTARNLLKRAIVNTMWAAMGRRNLVRFARFLTNEARLDLTNDMTANGEFLVQDFALRRATSSMNKVVFDVGANIGEWTHQLLSRSALQKSLHVHAFEPSQETYKTLRRNLAAWKVEENVTVNNLALSSTTGSRDFYTIGDNAGRNSLHPVDKDQQRIETIQVKTLDEYARDAAITEIALVKIDTEGHDVEVISGALRLLESQKIACIQFEYNHRWIAARHYLRDAFDLLKPLGYEIGKITPFGIEFYPDWHPELESFREANYLAVRKQLVCEFPQIAWWHSD